MFARPGDWLGKLWRSNRGEAQIPAPTASALVHGLDEAEIDLICRRMRRRKYDAGHVLCRQGDAGDRLYVVEKGLIEASVDSAD